MIYKQFSKIYQAAKLDGDSRFRRNATTDLDPSAPHWRIFRLCHTHNNIQQSDCLVLPRDTKSAVDYLRAQITELHTSNAVPLWVKFSALATLFATILRWLNEFSENQNGGAIGRPRTVWRASAHGTFDREIFTQVSDADFHLIINETERVIRSIVLKNPVVEIDLCKATYGWLKRESSPTVVFAPRETSVEHAFFEGRLIVVLAACVCRIGHAMLCHAQSSVEANPTSISGLFADLGRYYFQLRRAVGAAVVDTYLHIESLYPHDNGAHFLHCPWRQYEMHREIAGLGGMVVKLAKETLPPGQTFEPWSVRLFVALSLRHRERQQSYSNRKNDGAVAWRLAVEAFVDSLQYQRREIASASVAAHYLAVGAPLIPAIKKRYKAQALNSGYKVSGTTDNNPPPQWDSAWLQHLHAESIKAKDRRKVVNRIAEYAQLYLKQPEEDWKASFQDIFSSNYFAAHCNAFFKAQAAQLLVNLVRIVLDCQNESFASARAHILSADFICEFCALLNEAFDLPFHANVEVRHEWQKTVLKLISSFDLEAMRKLPSDALLRLHSIAAHAGTTALRGLEWHERDMFAAVEATGRGVSASVVARSRTVTNASEREVKSALTLYANRRNFGRTSAVAYLQVVVLSDTEVQVFACGLCAGTLTTVVDRVKFTAIGDGKYAGCNTWFDALESFQPIFPGDTDVYKPSQTVLGGHPSFKALKKVMTQAAEFVAGAGVSDLLISPDPTLATVPWQYFLTEFDPTGSADHRYLVCHIPSVKWLHNALTEHHRVVARGWVPNYHQRGISGRMPTVPTPWPEKPDHDLRPTVAGLFGGGKPNLSEPRTHTSTTGISLGYVFGHGRQAKNGTVMTEAMNSDETKARKEWQDLADHRIVVLLSCHTAHGKQGNLRDFVAWPTYLLSRAKAVIAPPYEVPSDVAVKLAGQIGQDIRKTVDKAAPLSIPLGATYKEAVLADWRVSLFSLWGLATEFIRWLPREQRPEKS